MQARFAWLLGSLISASMVTGATAQPADGASPGATEEDAAAPGADPAAPGAAAAAGSPNAADPNAVQYGVAVRLRNVRVPAAVIELFVDRATGASNVGLGVELSRRKGTVELQLGLEFEHLQPEEGTFIKKGEPVPGYQADYIVSPEHTIGGKSFGWFTIEFTFLNHAPINKYLAVRYGGGAGLGILTGEIQHYDVQCNPSASNNNPEPGCRPVQLGGTASGASGPVKYDLPPVFPVVNAIVGLQIKPTDKAVINVETGIRTIPFFGISAGYLF
jgi:hypothetical protein